MLKTSALFGWLFLFFVFTNIAQACTPIFSGAAEQPAAETHVWYLRLGSVSPIISNLHDYTLVYTDSKSSAECGPYTHHIRTDALYIALAGIVALFSLYLFMRRRIGKKVIAGA